MYESGWTGLDLLTFCFTGNILSPPPEIYSREPITSMLFSPGDRFFEQILFCIDREMNVVEVKLSGGNREYSATSRIED